MAGLEAAEVVTLGACVADAPTSQSEEVKRLIGQLLGVLINDVQAQDVDVNARLKQLGIDAIGPAIGVGIGTLAAIIATIVYAIPGVKASGIARAIFFGIAAGIGYTAGALLFNGASLIKHYLVQLDTLIIALKKTIGNEGLEVEGEWQPPETSVPAQMGEKEEFYSIKLLKSLGLIEEVFAATNDGTCFRSSSATNPSIVSDPSCKCQSGGNCFSMAMYEVPMTNNQISGNYLNGTMNALSHIRKMSAAAGRGNLNQFNVLAEQGQGFIEKVKSENKTILNFAKKIYLNERQKNKKTPLGPIPDGKVWQQQIEGIVSKEINKLPAGERATLMKRLGMEVKMPAAAMNKMKKDQQHIQKVLDNFEKFRQSLGSFKDRNYHEPFVPSSPARTERMPEDDISLDDYEVKFNDINPNRDASLFKSISNRYQKQMLDGNL